MKKQLFTTVLTALVFIAGTILAASPWVLCSSGGSTVKVEPLHVQHCCDGHGTAVADAHGCAPESSNACDPCSDEVLTLHQKQARRTAQVAVSPAVVSVISLPAVIAAQSAVTVPHQQYASTGHPPGYVPLCTVLRT